MNRYRNAYYSGKWIVGLATLVMCCCYAIIWCCECLNWAKNKICGKGTVDTKSPDKKDDDENSMEGIQVDPIFDQPTNSTATPMN